MNMNRRDFLATAAVGSAALAAASVLPGCVAVTDDKKKAGNEPEPELKISF
ncbi:MAG TPA: hypothetical protein DIT75_02690, partial [Rikenellaceae bacterium]|nr:hypothetical protein [Rikenellaceae bacterium]